MNEDDKQIILDVVPFKVEKLPVRYLGVPLTSKRIGVKECKVLIDRIMSIVQNWKNRCLSYAGRLLLIASILESIHVYRASIFLLPQTVIKDINKILKNFLWNQGEVSNGQAKVSWKNICKAKCQGGLGLKDLGVWNKAMISKHIWHIATDKESLWVKWINTEKLKGRSIWAVNEENVDSQGWKNILRLRDEIREFMIMRIGDGTSAKLVYDNWSSIGGLQKFVTNRDIYNARLDVNTVVREIIDDGEFKWPEEWINKYPILTQIQKIVVNDSLKDKMMWRSVNGKVGEFSVKQAYCDLTDAAEQIEWCKIVWFSQNIPKHSFILWLAVQNKLTTQDKIRGWGSYNMMVCSLCHSDIDSH